MDGFLPGPLLADEDTGLALEVADHRVHLLGEIGHVPVKLLDLVIPLALHQGRSHGPEVAAQELAELRAPCKDLRQPVHGTRDLVQVHWRVGPGPL
eukprot:8563788-Pyramimonas_sp.AAC.1